jgi:hypothetical protein
MTSLPVFVRYVELSGTAADPCPAGLSSPPPHQVHASCTNKKPGTKLTGNHIHW